MEDTLRACEDGGTGRTAKVLILVLMEDTLRVAVFNDREDFLGLNPCFNGRYSQSVLLCSMIERTSCLNPCFNGRYSQSSLKASTLINNQS